MALEIERKFLVQNEDYRSGSDRQRYVQGYFPSTPSCTVRVRIAGDTAYLTIKSVPVGIVRNEYEYVIPMSDAQEMLEFFCGKPLIEKTRHSVEFGGHRWVIDEFRGENLGLVVAEIELEEPGARFPLPPWVGREVTGEEKYQNSRLGSAPFGSWPENRK